MKRLMLTGLCLGMSIWMTACGANNNAWIEEGTQKLETELSSSEVYINGTVYTFPSDMSYWINTGWHISNNYENKDEFELEPGIESTEFELFNDNKQYVTVTVLNMSDENAKIEDCMVSSLEIKLSSSDKNLQVVLPGGIYAKSGAEDIIQAYGEPTSEEGSDSDKVLNYEYTTEDEDAWICNVEMELNDTKKPLETVKYTLTDDNWGGSKEDVLTYVDTALRASFYGDFEEYVANLYDTEENASALYQSEIDYYAEGLMYYLDMDSSLLDEATIEGYRSIAKTVLGQAKWEITDFSYDEMNLKGTMGLVMYPIDFLELIDDDANAVIAEFQNKYSSVDPDSCTEEELKTIKQDYANMMLEAISARAGETGVSIPVTKVYNIDYAEGVISEDDWNEIDDILMGFGE